LRRPAWGNIRKIMSSVSPVILCIEDDKDTAALLAEDLTERGYRVLLAHDGAEGLRRILAERPDLVLCDVSLPVMSGFDVLARLSDITPRLGHMPFLFLTALTDRDSMLKGRNLGADDYVTKPVDFELLDAIIRQKLDRTPRNAIWPATVQLNPREIEILTWAARGKTSSEIAQILGLSKRTVDFHADNARTKLGAATRIEATIKAATQRIIRP
jgi:DNA-binding response OmpR family regulator